MPGEDAKSIAYQTKDIPLLLLFGSGCHYQSTLTSHVVLKWPQTFIDVLPGAIGVFTNACGAVLSVLGAGSTGSSRQSVFDKLNYRWLDQVRADVERP